MRLRIKGQPVEQTRVFDVLGSEVMFNVLQRCFRGVVPLAVDGSAVRGCQGGCLVVDAR